MLVFALQKGNGELSLEQEEQLSQDQLTDEWAMQLWEKDFRFALPAMVSAMKEHDEEVMKLPVSQFHLQLPLSDEALFEDAEAVEAELVRQHTKYSEAYVPGMRMKSETHGIGCTWSLIPTLLPKVAWYGVLDPQSPDDVRFVAYDDVMKLFGNNLEIAGDDVYYMPGRDELPSHILDQLLSYPIMGNQAQQETSASDNNSSNDSTQDADDKSDLTALIMAPAVVIVTVSGADGSIDKKEVAAAGKYLTKCLKNPDVTMELKACIHASMENMQKFVNSFDGAQSFLSLALVRPAAKKLFGEAAADEYGKILVQLAQEIAAASGGFLGMFGSKISKEEQQMIETIKKLVCSDT